ncbi:Ig-like domain-containing protein [Tenacibaculum maritimum]|uniref:Ig-like domain-containing protein n=1 Tax=Tenacibaculum maritimum TaxID=107401 RepID=UPI003875C1D7
MQKNLLILLITITTILSTNAQTHIATVNGGTSRNDFPLNLSWNYSYSQFIYLGTEINKSGNIKSLTFKLIGTAPANIDTWKNWKVSLKEINNNEFPNAQTNPWLSPKYSPFGSLTEVFNGDIIYSQTAKTAKIILTTPFKYDHSKNLLVEIYDQTVGTAYNVYFDTKNNLSEKRGINASSTTFTHYTSSSNMSRSLTSIPAIDIEIQDIATSPATSTTNLNYCEGDNLKLTAEDAGTGATYLWTIPDGTTVNQKDLTINNVTTSETGIYSLTVTKNGCQNTASSNIKIFPSPLLTATSFEVCVGENLQLITNGNPGPAATLPFTSSDTSIVTVTDTGILSAIKSGKVHITYTNNNGCSITKEITIHSQPIANLVNDTASNIICTDTLVTFTANGGDEYEFFVNGLSVQGKSANHIYTSSTLNNGDRIKVKVWNSRGCDRESAETIITVKPTPIITKLEAINTPLCMGENGQFLIEGTPGAVISYTINAGSIKTTTLTGGTSTIILSSLTTNQTITLNKISINNCEAIINNTSSIIVTPKPIAIIKRK